jgi:hypothetical protein
MIHTYKVSFKKESAQFLHRTTEYCVEVSPAGLPACPAFPLQLSLLILQVCTSLENPSTQWLFDIVSWENIQGLLWSLPALSTPQYPHTHTHHLLSSKPISNLTIFLWGWADKKKCHMRLE